MFPVASWKILTVNSQITLNHLQVAWKTHDPCKLAGSPPPSYISKPPMEATARISIYYHIFLGFAGYAQKISIQVCIWYQFHIPLVAYRSRGPCFWPIQPISRSQSTAIHHKKGMDWVDISWYIPSAAEKLIWLPAVCHYKERPPNDKLVNKTLISLWLMILTTIVFMGFIYWKHAWDPCRTCWLFSAPLFASVRPKMSQV
jgi:hypothetical protein